MHVFDAALALDEIGAEGGRGRAQFVASLDQRWWVADAGPWGGYISALLARAVSQTVPELDLVSLTTHFVRRLRAGPATVEVEVASRGARVGHAVARLAQDEGAGAIAMVTLGRNPQPDFVSDLPLPDAPAFNELPRRQTASHRYLDHFDVRAAITVRPWAGDNEGTLAGWVTMVEPRPLDLALLAALPDVWMPGTWARLTTPHGKVTVEQTTYFRADIAPQDSGPWFLRVRTRHVERGFADEECEVWGGDGRLLAQSRQLVLLARA